jgi:hypothetical protein
VASFYLDENIDWKVVPLLVNQGHQAVTCGELGLYRAGDQRHLLTAAQNGWLLLTNNRADFRLLHDAWLQWSAVWQVSAVHAGILICIQEWSPPRLAREIEEFLLLGLSLANQLYEYRGGRGWVQRR